MPTLHTNVQFWHSASGAHRWLPGKRCGSLLASARMLQRPGDVAGGWTSMEELERSAEAHIIRELRLRRPVTDGDFDQHLSPELQECSSIHWTPVEVAKAAAQYLVDRPGARVLDVGCGPGKLCIIGAATTDGVFTGVDRRASVIQEARRLTALHGVERAFFIQGEMEFVDWDLFDGIYLFNPFAEHLLDPDEQIDQGRLTSAIEYRRCVELARGRLARARPGTRVVTFHGYGGSMPACYHLSGTQHFGGGLLKLWVRLDEPTLHAPSTEEGIGYDADRWFVDDGTAARDP